MKKVEEHIFDLLFKHDCITLPNFGGFVCQYTGAQFSEEQKIIFPPSKKISFNRHIKNDDGLLTHEIANHRNISYSEANQSLKLYIEDLKVELEKNKRVEISKLGVLFLDAQNTLKFLAVETNFSIESFGLPTINAVKIKKIEQNNIVSIEDNQLIADEIEIKDFEKNTPVIPIEKHRKSKSNWWVAAVLIPILFYSAWIPMKTELLKDSTQFHYSDLNPFTFQKNKKYVGKQLELFDISTIESKSLYTETIQKINLDDSIYLWVDNRPTIPASKRETTYVENKQPEIKPTINLDAHYHLIGGCFGNEENAKNLVNQMTELGYTAKILDQNKGLYRVSIGQFTKRKTAKKQKEKLKSDYAISSWILKQ